MEPVLDDANEDAGDTDAEPQTDAEPTDGEESNTTPSQSRSSSIHPPVAQATTPAAPEDDSVDVFDGYSFKGRHSVLLDDEDEEEGSEEGSESDEGDILKDLDVELEPETPKRPTEEGGDTEDGEGDAEDAEGAEPKTPEARPVVPVEPVPELPAQQEDAIMEEPRVLEPEPEPEPEVVPATTTDTAAAAAAAPVAVREEPKPRKSKEQARAPVPEKELPAPQVPPKPSRLGRPRREKSGVPALDRYLSDAIDEDAEATEKEDEEDDDWDFVEAADGEDRNGAKGTSLFARGVVDRYRLAVFRKASTPSQRTVPRSFSGISRDSEATGAGTEASDSPSPSQRRGRTPGLTFRKHPRQFLRPKSPPPSSYSSKSSLSGSKPMSRSNSATMSSSGGLLTPSPSASATMMSPSLKSKESAMSMGAQSSSSGENGKVEVLSDGRSRAPSSPPDGGERPKNKKLKKYKENAEKVFSLFSSPRQPAS
jgi:hypothetical protein